MQPHERDEVYLEHILETAERVRSKLDGLLREDYDVDENLRLALIHMV